MRMRLLRVLVGSGFAFFVVCALADEPAAMAVEEVEEVLSGSGTSLTYLRIFGGVVALPNSFVFDSQIHVGARFRRPGGRVLVGSYGDISAAVRARIDRRASASQEVCGLTVVSWEEQGRARQLVHDGAAYLLFDDDEPRLWQAALHMYCLSKLGPGPLQSERDGEGRLRATNHVSAFGAPEHSPELARPQPVYVEEDAYAR